MVKICRQRSRAAPEAKLIAEAYSKEGFRRGLRVSLTRCVCTTNAYLAISFEMHFYRKTNKKTTFCQHRNNKEYITKNTEYIPKQQGIYKETTKTTKNQHRIYIETTKKFGIICKDLTLPWSDPQIFQIFKSQILQCRESILIGFFHISIEKIILQG